MNATDRVDVDLPAPRVLLLTASMGSGHLEVAAELAARLRMVGAETDTVDILEAAGSAGRRVRTTYRLLLRWLPWFYDLVMRWWARHPAAWERLTASGAGPFEHVIRSRARRFGADVVVSTYNLAGQCAGRLRQRGELAVPALMFVIDPGAHPYWTHSGIDGYLVPTAEMAGTLPIGRTLVEVVGPVVRAEFLDPPTRDDARSQLGLGARETVVLVSAGSWAAGHLQQTTLFLAAQPGLRVVVLCGRDASAANTVRSTGAVAVPWTDNIVAYLRAADVLVDNAGGLTCWEALTVGTPVVIHDPLPGHGRLNAAALQRAGLATWARQPADLVRAVRRPPAPARLPQATADPVAVILAAAGRTPPHSSVPATRASRDFGVSA